MSFMVNRRLGLLRDFALLLLAVLLAVPSVWAASPSVVTATESNATANDTSPFTVGRAAGVLDQLTIVVIGMDGDPTLTYPSGYIELCTVDRGGTFKLSVAYHQEDGTEGTAFNVTSSTSEKWAAIVYSISGAANPSSQPPECATVDGGAGTTASPDPPYLNPFGGTFDFLFIAAALNDGEAADDDVWGEFPPVSYLPDFPRQKTTGTDGLATTNISLETAERALTAAAEDPGDFSNGAVHTYAAATIAVFNPIIDFGKAALAMIVLLAMFVVVVFWRLGFLAARRRRGRGGFR